MYLRLLFLLQVTKKKAESTSDDLDAASFDWKEHDRLETERLFSASSRGSTDALAAQQHKSDSDASSSCYSNSRETSDVTTVDSTAEDMLRKCYKTNDVTSLMERMNFSDPKLDRENGVTQKQDSTSSAPVTSLDAGATSSTAGATASATGATAGASAQASSSKTKQVL